VSKVRSIKLDGFEPEILKVMAEIGNDVSKRIYEAKVAEIIAKRATPDCSKEQRENWIKAKYVTRAFINTEALNVEGSDKWTVRRLRRRKRTSSLKKQEEEFTTAKESQDKDEKDEDSTQIPREDSNSSILEACGIEQEKKRPINAETLVFGGTLSKHHFANFEVRNHSGNQSSKTAAIS